MSSPLKPVRRIVTVDRDDGTSTAIADGPSPDVRLDPARPAFSSTRIWVTDRTPARLKNVCESLDTPHTLEPPPQGSVCRVVTFPPEDGFIRRINATDVQRYFESMGSPGASTHHARAPHPYMQKTRTLDFCLVLEGEITLVLDTEEVHLKAGDTVVQRGTNHAWSNRSNRPLYHRILVTRRDLLIGRHGKVYKGRLMDMDHIAPGLARLIDPEGTMDIVAQGTEFGEGPVWDRRTRQLYYVDIIGNTIWKWKPGVGKEIVMHPTGFANGMTFDKEGRLLVCGWSSRNVWRMEKDGALTILTERCDGKKYNSPNDIVMRSDGTIYFTDSAGGLVNIGMVAAGTDIQRQAEVQGVYRIAPDGTVSLATGAISYPNGLALSPDEKLLYVNDTRVNKLYVHDVRADGSLSETREWVQLQGKEAGNADGMKVDSEGNVYTSGPSGVHILNPAGQLLGRIRFPNHVSNLCWGEDDWKTLFITDHHRIYRTRVKIAGVPVW